jgi:hypothetical protein
MSGVIAGGAIAAASTKLCTNGHKYAKRLVAKAGIAFEALDNGMLSCPQR